MFETVVTLTTSSVIPVDYLAPQGADVFLYSMDASPAPYLSAGNTLPPPKN